MDHTADTVDMVDTRLLPTRATATVPRTPATVDTALVMAATVATRLLPTVVMAAMATRLLPTVVMATRLLPSAATVATLHPLLSQSKISKLRPQRLRPVSSTWLVFRTRDLASLKKASALPLTEHMG